MDEWMGLAEMAVPSVDRKGQKKIPGRKLVG